MPQAANQLFLNPLLYNLRHRAFPQAQEKLEVVVSRLGEEAAALGAVLTVREMVLAARCREVDWNMSTTRRGLSPNRKVERDAAGPPTSSDTRIT